MKRFFLLLSFTLLMNICVLSQNNSSKIAGAYQFCPFPCETYKINADFTFDYLLDGDLFNNERTKGTWQFVGENKIYLKTLNENRKLIYKVTEEIDESKVKILVQILDINGAVFPGIPVKLNYKGQDYQFITDVDGECEIFKVNKIEVNYSHFLETYEIKNLQTTKLKIEMYPSTEPSFKETFLIKKGALCKISENEKISENCYQKLKKKTVKKLFPNK